MRNSKIKSLPDIVAFVKAAQKSGKRVVTTNGCFDILHIGHVRYLQEAKKRGDVLVVGINSDASVRAVKGSERPIVPARERAEIIAALGFVDAVFIFSEKDPRKWLARVRPDIHAKGGDRTMGEIIEKEVVEEGGGVVLLLPVEKGKSTSALIEKILKISSQRTSSRK
jgi:D-beta-D-heptose 7-phosphate kinase/D-beta-D-heptose 1-phosphate adenosyltransferase